MTRLREEMKEAREARHTEELVEKVQKHKEFKEARSNSNRVYPTEEFTPVGHHPEMGHRG